MYRGWLGAGLLALFLALGIVTMTLMDNAHLPTGDLLEQAAELALQGELERGAELGMRAKYRWEKQWQATATVADHSPMDDVDALFAEMKIYAAAGEAPHFAACCKELAKRVQAVAEAHRFSWWNIF